MKGHVSLAASEAMAGSADREYQPSAETDTAVLEHVALGIIEIQQSEVVAGTEGYAHRLGRSDLDSPTSNQPQIEARNVQSELPRVARLVDLHWWGVKDVSVGLTKLGIVR